MIAHSVRLFGSFPLSLDGSGEYRYDRFVTGVAGFVMPIGKHRLRSMSWVRLPILVCGSYTETQACPMVLDLGARSRNRMASLASGFRVRRLVLTGVNE